MNEQNEMMELEEVETIDTMDDEEIEERGESSGIGTGLAILIGAGLASAVYAGVKHVPKLVAKLKARKEQKAAVESESEPVEVIDINEAMNGEEDANEDNNK